ncbi:alpha-(1,3)-fucosyltransferase C-like [Colias croceus]|uniref:alpha-(1,3)-fucosyltransferase C-like n=1 Tax=Colias crocea TaxID=72248 RepID=UPI001E27F236|nr:alpha-(1,3)-fucosyltransferase C-like [Colias croceus]
MYGRLAYSHYNSAIFKNGQKAFLDHNCTQYNCFLTNDKSLLLDLRYYDAILFDVENNWEDHPPVRAPHQRYIFTASESAGNYPICDDYFENYYNLTWTYKLNSDIPWTYITIVDKNNTVIGPKVNLTWVEHMDPTPDFVKKKLLKKKKAVAWFVSNCYSKARQKVANDIAVSLSKYNLKLDVYGWCGNKTCPRDRIEDCLDLLQKDYFFYLALEKSMAEDYVTEKILYPLLHYTVPIVYGGANYSRFLPPSSYIDAGKLNSDEIATLIVEAINNRNVYEDYFRWHNHYTYKESPVIADVCSLCELLHSQENEFKSINKFRQWWNPSYKELCKNEHHFVDIKNK